MKKILAIVQVFLSLTSNLSAYKNMGKIQFSSDEASIVETQDIDTPILNNNSSSGDIEPDNEDDTVIEGVSNDEEASDTSSNEEPETRVYYYYCTVEEIQVTEDHICPRANGKKNVVIECYYCYKEDKMVPLDHVCPKENEPIVSNEEQAASVVETPKDIQATPSEVLPKEVPQTDVPKEETTTPLVDSPKEEVRTPLVDTPKEEVNAPLVETPKGEKSTPLNETPKANETVSASSTVISKGPNPPSFTVTDNGKSFTVFWKWDAADQEIYKPGYKQCWPYYNVYYCYKQDGSYVQAMTTNSKGFYSFTAQNVGAYLGSTRTKVTTGTLYCTFPAFPYAKGTKVYVKMSAINEKGIEGPLSDYVVVVSGSY
jgi:hypothetical protein